MTWSPRRLKASRASLDAPKPLRRSEELITEAVGEELLVYDRTSKRAHCLSATAARVWQACDGRSELTAISGELGLSLDLVREAVDELRASELLDQGLEVVNIGSENGNGKVVTRREMAVRSAKLGAAAATAPLILSITAPTASAAITPTPYACGVYSAKSCGSGSGCALIAGCCCCCPSTTPGSCFECAPTHICNATTPCVAPFQRQPSGCSAEGPATGTGPDAATGCCGQAALQGCGCAFNQGVTTPATGAGGVNTGSGCCDTSTPDPANPGRFLGCVPGTSPTNTCVPCCNGAPIHQGAPFQCCPGPGTGTNTGTC